MELAPINGYTNIGWTPGYENILFPGSNPIPGTNASVQVTYSDPTMTTPDTTLNQVLPDLAAFDTVVNVDPSSSCCCSSGSSVPDYIIDIPSTPTPPVPEPGTIVLMVLGSRR